jgi:hypothetical protein
VSHAALGAEFDAKCAFGGEGETIVRGLAVDKELRSFGGQVGNGGTGGVALLPDEEEQSDFDAGLAELVCSSDLRGDDALGPE